MTQQFNIKNTKVDGTVEHLLGKIMVMATGQPLTKELFDGLFAFKAQDETWNSTATIVNNFLTDTLAARGGNQNAYLKELFANAGTTFTDATLSTALQYYTSKGATTLFDIFVTALLDPLAPGYSNLTAKTATQATSILVSLGLNNITPTGSLSVQGVAAEDATLTAFSTLADADGIPTTGANAIKYQWLADGQNIAGATNSTFKLGQSNVGQKLSVKATWTDNGGTVESVTSAATTAVSNVNDAPTGSVTIVGSAMQGQTLTASNTVRDEDGIPSSGTGALKYQWLANGQNIVGATNSTLSLDQSHLGKTISVKAGYTDSYGTGESVTSLATSAVAAPKDLGRWESDLTATAGFPLRVMDTFAAYKSFVFDENVPARLTDFNGKMMYVWGGDGNPPIDKTGSSLNLPVYSTWTNGLGQDVVTENLAIVLDFSDGAKTAIIDLSPRYTPNQKHFVFKNFDADDAVKFTYINEVNSVQTKWPMTPYDGFPNSIQATNMFSDQSAYEASGKAMREAKTLGTANVFYTQDATFTFSDTLVKALTSRDPMDSAYLVTQPERVAIHTVGALAIDVHSSSEGGPDVPPIFDRYMGMGADGDTDFLITFVGALPDSMNINVTFGSPIL